MSSALSALIGGPQTDPSGGSSGLPSQGAGQPGAPDNPDAEQSLQDAISSLHDFMSAEEDDQDKSVAAKCLAQLQSILGGRQKQEEAAQGVTPAHKAMGRAYSKSQKQSGPGGGY